MITRILFLSILIAILTNCRADTSTETVTSDDALAAAPGAFDDAKLALENNDLAAARRILVGDYGRVANDSTGMVDPRAGQQYMDLAQQFANNAKGDTMAAVVLFKSAEVHQAMGDHAGAAVLFERIYEEYPNFSKSGDALFMLGFTYDENLKDFDRAETTYEKFLVEYPKSVFVPSAQSLLENLGKTDEEMLEALSRKSQQ